MLSRRILLETTRYPAKIAFSSFKGLAAIKSAKSLDLTHGFVQALGQVGQVQVRRGLVAFGLEAGIEALLRTSLVSQVRTQKTSRTYPSKSNFIAQVVEATNTLLGVADVGEFCKPKSPRH